VFRDQLRRHIAAEHAAMCRPAQAKLTGDPRGQALLEAMGDERQLIGPLQAVADDAFARGADPGRLRPLLARLRTKLTSHLAHEEADALPLLGQIMSPAELGTIAGALRSGTGGGRAAHTIPWALARASPALRTQVLSQLPAPTTRLLYRTIWLPRHTAPPRHCEEHQVRPPAGCSRRVLPSPKPVALDAAAPCRRAVGAVVRFGLVSRQASKDAKQRTSIR
jgi:Hemerythrin HHE cation binding domain